MRIAVLYRSKNGYTERYARWLSERLSADLLRADEIRPSELAPYQLLLYGGGLYATGINGLKALLSQLGESAAGRLIVFAVGVTPARPEVTLELKTKNLPHTLQEAVPLFYLRGGFDRDRLKGMDRLLIALLRVRLMLKTSLSPDERGMLAACRQAVSFSDIRNTDPIVDCVNAIRTGPSVTEKERR